MKPNKITPWIPIIGFGYLVNCYWNYDISPEELGLDEPELFILSVFYQAAWLYMGSFIYLIFQS